MSLSLTAAYYAHIRTDLFASINFLQLRNDGADVGSARIDLDNDSRVTLVDDGAVSLTITYRITLRSTDTDLSGVTEIDGYNLFTLVTGGDAYASSTFTAKALDANNGLEITINISTPA